jgi:tetratricopeptide (TPR) repeat protein
LTSRWQISAGEITEWLMPLLFVFAVLASAWVLHDARRRFPLYAVAAWMLATLVSAPVVLPLYLIARTFKPLPAAKDAAPETTSPQETEETEADSLKEIGAAGLKETDAAGVIAAREETPDDTGEHVATEPSPTIRATLRLKRYAPSLLYSLALLSASAIYFYRDYRSFDAHLARGARARLLGRRDAAIREYRSALRFNDDAHTHKLLAVQLAEDGQTEAALAEFRAAERGGEPDELLALRIASSLDALGRAGEAADEYRKFLQGGSCTRPLPDARCAEAAARLGQTQGGAVAR